MKISFAEAHNLLIHCSAVVVNDDERTLIRPELDGNRDKLIFLSLKYPNGFVSKFSENKNQEIEYDENYGWMTLINEDGNEIEIRLLKPMRREFDTNILDDLPLDRGAKAGIERFIPYDRLGYEYQQWLHKHREALIKENGRFIIDKDKDKQEQVEIPVADGHIAGW